MNKTGIKYYLRGLGIGIIVTALLVGYSQKGQPQMTDEEIRQRAAQLGMTEPQGVLSELSTASPDSNLAVELNASPTPEPAAEPTADLTPNSTEEPTTSPIPQQPTEEPTASSAPGPTEEPTESSAPASTEEPMASSTPVLTGEVVTLVVTRGESSVTVSQNLEELGLVEDYRAFDHYLCDNEYDHSISIGTYEIPLGTTEEEIARIICKLQ